MTGLSAMNPTKIGALSRDMAKGGTSTSSLHNPDVLILDEPTTGADPNQLDDIRSLIKRLVKIRPSFFPLICRSRSTV